MVEALAGAALAAEAAAGAGDVRRCAGPVGRFAEALAGLFRARHVRLLGLVGDPAPGLLGDLHDPLVGAIHGAPVTASRGATIEHVLHGGVDVDALPLPCNLDPVRKGRHSPVRPAGTAVLRNVLVPRDRAVVDP